jgi:hypothetical protein
LASPMTGSGGYPVITGLSLNRDVTEYWIIRFRG